MRVFSLDSSSLSESRRNVSKGSVCFRRTAYLALVAPYARSKRNPADETLRDWLRYHKPVNDFVGDVWNNKAEGPRSLAGVLDDTDTIPIEDVLPAWFSSRMASDVGLFGLHLSDGSVMVVTTVVGCSEASDGSIWIDAEMAQKGDCDFWVNRLGTSRVITTHSSRTTVSINAGHIIAAFEIADA